MHVLKSCSRRISDAVIKTFSITEPEEDESVEGKVPTAPFESMSMADKMALWQSKEYSPEHNLTLTDLWDDGMDIDDAFEAFPELQEYSDMLLRSSAFSWLLHSVQNQVNLEVPGLKNGKGQIEIRQKILDVFEEPRRLSRRAASATHTMTFHLSWIWDFFDTQEYGVSASEALGHVLALTGTPCNAWATTLSQYVRTVWPDIGTHILDLFETLLQQGPRAVFECMCHLLRMEHQLSANTTLFKQAFYLTVQHYSQWRITLKDILK